MHVRGGIDGSLSHVGFCERVIFKNVLFITSQKTSFLGLSPVPPEEIFYKINCL